VAELHTHTGLRVVTDGDAPADVLLIGGIAEDSAAWEAQVAALSAAHRVIRYDARGVGTSPAPLGPYSLDELVDDAVAVLDAAWSSHAHIVGSSLGSAIAQRLALDHPDRVLSLTLSGGYAAADRAFSALADGWVYSAVRARSLGELLAIVNRWAYGPDAWNSGLVDIRVAEREQELEGAGEDERWELIQEAFIWTVTAALEHDAESELQRINVPTLVLVGEHDAILPPVYSRRLAELIPDSELVVVDHAGHQVFQEAPAVFNDLLLGFLHQQALQRLAA
jgi:pimeloyl-ACP methyl ester carboxylesterase